MSKSIMTTIALHAISVWHVVGSIKMLVALFKSCKFLGEASTDLTSPHSETPFDWFRVVCTFSFHFLRFSDPVIWSSSFSFRHLHLSCVNTSQTLTYTIINVNGSMCEQL